MDDTKSGEPVALTLYLEPDVHRILTDLKRTDGYTLNGFIRAAVNEKLARMRPESPTLAVDVARS